MENPRIDFEEEMYDQCSHSYQDGFNSGYKQGQIDTIKRFCNITPQKTNAERIRAKTDEELARFLGGMGCPEGLSPNSQKCPIPLDYSDEDACYKCWLDWLKKEATNESND